MRLTPKTVVSDFTNEHAWLAGQNYRAWSVTLDAATVRANADGDKVLRSGTVLGRITASNLHGPVKRTVLAATAAAAQKDAVVDDAQFFQVGDSIIIGTEAANVIAAIDYDTNTLTMTNSIAAEQAEGATVRADNGLETAAAILLNTINLRDGNQAEAAVFEGVAYAARLTGLDAASKTALSGKFHWREF